VVFINIKDIKNSDSNNKKEGCHPDNQSFQLTLKSNTMKNTMQNYCFFPYLQALLRGISAKACFY